MLKKFFQHWDANTKRQKTRRKRKNMNYHIAECLITKCLIKEAKHWLALNPVITSYSNGKVLIVFFTDGTVKIWDGPIAEMMTAYTGSTDNVYATYEELVEPIDPFNPNIPMVSFNDDGECTIHGIMDK